MRHPLGRATANPSYRGYATSLLLLVGAVLGVIFWGAFNTFMEYTNTMDFCISCHEMRTTVYEEYKQTAHFRNNSGVRATCADCHVPRAWTAKLTRKIQATFNEVPHKILGTIDTPEKFEAKRREMAENVWRSMKRSDSQECRNCHTLASMTLATQPPRAKAQHEDSLKTGETCIDCHQGIAHKKPADIEESPPQGFAL